MKKVGGNFRLKVMTILSVLLEWVGTLSLISLPVNGASDTSRFAFQLVAYRAQFGLYMTFGIFWFARKLPKAGFLSNVSMLRGFTIPLALKLAQSIVTVDIILKKMSSNSKIVFLASTILKLPIWTRNSASCWR